MKNLLVLDKEEYRQKHDEFLKLMDKNITGRNIIMYTSYEDDMIRKVRNYKYIGSVMQHFLYWRKSYNYAKQILNEQYDNIYCMNPIVGVFLGLKNKKSKIVLSGFLFEPKKNKLYYWLRKKVTAKSLRRIEIAIVYGAREVNYYKKIFRNVTKFQFVKYGIDFPQQLYYTNKVLPNEFFFSGGGSNRDYRTLIEAYNLYFGKDILIIATQPWRLKGMDTSRVCILEDVVMENFGDVLGKAKALVLSLTDGDISAGHMVMFQAMSQCIPVIVNDIPAIRDYVDEECVTFYKSADTKELSEILYDFDNHLDKYIEKAHNAKKVYTEYLTFESLLERIIAILSKD